MNRKCTTCGESFPETVEFFAPEKKSPGGISRRCRLCKRAANRKYRKSAKGRAKHRPSAYSPEYQAKWRSENPNYHKEWLAKRQGYTTEQSRQWRALNMTADERSQENRKKASLRRSRKVSTHGTYNTSDIRRMLQGQKYKCWWCQKKLDDYHVDHRIPLSRGGGNGADNIVISCPPCNQKKWAHMPWRMPDGPRLL